MYVVCLTFVLHPYMFEFKTGDEHEVVLADHLVAVADDTSHSGSVFYEVEFKHLMIVNRIGELLLMAVGYVENIVFTERRDLVKHMFV